MLGWQIRQVLASRSTATSASDARTGGCRTAAVGIPSHHAAGRGGALCAGWCGPRVALQAGLPIRPGLFAANRASRRAKTALGDGLEGWRADREHVSGSKAHQLHPRDPRRSLARPPQPDFLAGKHKFVSTHLKQMDARLCRQHDSGRV